MLTNKNTFSVTDLRHNTNKVLDAAKIHDIVYLLKHSRREVAVVNVEFLESLMEAYEDYMDTLEFDRAKKEGGGISLDDFKKKYNIE